MKVIFIGAIGMVGQGMPKAKISIGLEPSFRDGPKDQTRNLDIPGSMRSLSAGRALRGPVGIAPE